MGQAAPTAPGRDRFGTAASDTAAEGLAGARPPPSAVVSVRSGRRPAPHGAGSMSTVRRGATPLLLPTRIREPSAAATPRPPAPAPAPAATATARTAAPPSSPPTPPTNSARTAAPRPPSTGPGVARRSADEAVDECDKSHSPGPAEPRWQRGQGRRAITGRCVAGPWPGRAAQCTDPTEHPRPPTQPHTPTPPTPPNPQPHQPSRPDQTTPTHQPSRPDQAPTPTPTNPATHPTPPIQPHTPTPAHTTTRPPPPLHATALHGARRAAPAPARREPGASGDGTGPRPSGAHRLDYGADRERRRGHEDGGAGYATVPRCATAAPDRPRGPNTARTPLR